MSRSDDRFIGLCAGVSLFCPAILLSGRHPLVNLLAAAPLVFYLPGWSFLRALGLKFEGRLESTVLIVALSLAIVVVVGIALSLLGAITRPGWLSALTAFTLAACAVGLAREAPAAATLAASPPRVTRRPYGRPIEILQILLAVGLAAGAFAILLKVTPGVNQFHYSQLWIVPKHDAPNNVVIGLHNAESGDVNYVVELQVDHQLVETWNDVSLKPGETWTKTFRWVGYGFSPHPVQPLKQSAAEKRQPASTVLQRIALGPRPRIEALVYRSDQRSVVYRHVWLAPQCPHEVTQGRPQCE